MQQKRSIIWTIASICWGILIAILLLMPPPDMQDVSTFIHRDKVIHFILFGVWTVLLLLAYKPQNAYSYQLLVVIISGYAILTELLQLLTKDRNGDFADVIADLLGMVVALYLYRRYMLSREVEVMD